MYTMDRCNIQMREQPRRDVSDKFSWWCPQCKTRKTIREGSFFHKSHTTLQQWLLLIYLWARQYPVSDVAEEAGVDRSTAIDIFQWLREVCSTKLLQTPIVLGGTVDEVQIDESLFRHKPKVNKVHLLEVVGLSLCMYCILKQAGIKWVHTVQT